MTHSHFKRAMDRLLAFFQRPLAIKLYFLTQIYLTYIYFNMRFCFYASRTEADLAGAGERDGREQRTSAGDIQRLSGGAHVRSSSDKFHWTWCHFPAEPRFIAFYKIVSCSALCYSLLKNVTPEPLLQLIGLFNPDPNSTPNECYLLGRFVLDFSSLSGVTSVLFGFYHLVWRLSQLAWRRPYTFTFVAYMAQSDQEVRAFVEEFESRKSSGSGNALHRSDETGKLHERATPASSGGGGGGAGEPEPTRGAARNCLLGHELFMRNMMFYEVAQRSGVHYKLRANRSVEARREIKRKFAINFLLSSLIFTALIATVGAGVITAIVFDWGYTRSYPGCGAPLAAFTGFRLRPFGGLLGDEWAISFTAHRVVAFFADCFENVIWMDSGYSLTFAHSFLILLNQDLMLYWRHLHAKIELTLKRVRQNYLDGDQQPGGGRLGSLDLSSLNLESCFLRQRPTRVHLEKTTAGSGSRPLSRVHAERKRLAPDDDDDDEHEHDNYKQKATTTIRHLARVHKPSMLASQRASGASLSPSSGFKAHQELEQVIFELQAEVSDFFKQIRAVDMIVSDLLTSFICIWFTTFAPLSYHSIIRSRSDGMPVVIYLISAFHFVTITLTSLNVFQLHAGCLRSYRLICSLMAYDQSRHKRRFAKMLYYYTNQRRSTYTIFQQYPYTPSTYLSVIGWTFSCFFIIESLFKYARFKAS